MKNHRFKVKKSNKTFKVVCILQVSWQKCTQKQLKSNTSAHWRQQGMQIYTWCLSVTNTPWWRHRRHVTRCAFQHIFERRHHVSTSTKCLCACWSDTKDLWEKQFLFKLPARLGSQSKLSHTTCAAYVPLWRHNTAIMCLQACAGECLLTNMLCSEKAVGIAFVNAIFSVQLTHLFHA